MRRVDARKRLHRDLEARVGRGLTRFRTRRVVADLLRCPGLRRSAFLGGVDDERGEFAGVLLASFGADVIKVEPPSGDTWRIGNKIPPQPRSHDNYPWHLNNRNKRGLALDLKSPHAGEILERKLKGWN